VTVPMKDAAPGPVTLNLPVRAGKPDKLQAEGLCRGASLDRLTLSAGDPSAMLKGTRLDEVAKAELDGNHADSGRAEPRAGF
jgi:hypothetical protein